MTNNSPSRRDASALAVAVKNHFDWLISGSSYVVSSAEPERVELSDGDISINVSIEPGSYLIELELRRASTGDRYNLHEILTAIAPLEANRIGYYALNDDALQQCVQQLGALCHQHLLPLFSGDSAAFAAVESAARRIRERTTLEYQYGAIIDRANLAWEGKSWQEALRLYESAERGLSPSEARRLQFLRGKTNLQ